MKINMSKSNSCILEDFKEIIELFKEDASGAAPFCYIDPGMPDRFFLSGETRDGETNELMLRLNYKRRKLIIARISFVNQRKGNGSRLLELLYRFAKTHDYQTLHVESVMTKPMECFVKKHGFKIESDDRYELNWIKIL